MIPFDWLETEDFYRLMQAYRMAPGYRPPDLIHAFEAVKEAIREHFRAEEEHG